jgi:hypothetical protein
MPQCTPAKHNKKLFLILIKESEGASPNYSSPPLTKPGENLSRIFTVRTRWGSWR